VETADTTADPRRLFSVASAVTQVDTGRFGAELDPQWTIGGKPNGGYLLSVLARAATFSGVHDHVIAASAHYLRAPEPGPVEIEIEPLRLGRSASQVRARMGQVGQACVEALFTLSHLEPDTSSYWDGGVPEISTSVYADLPRLIPSLPNGIPVAILHQVEVRLDAESAANLIEAGRVDESCFVWDCTGRLVAHGTQLAGIRLG
jgi:hypothetical protein